MVLLLGLESKLFTGLYVVKYSSCLYNESMSRCLEAKSIGNLYIGWLFMDNELESFVPSFLDRCFTGL